MQCVNGHQNPYGSNFCGTCGATAASVPAPPGNPGFPGFPPPNPGFPPQNPGFPGGYTPQASTGFVQIPGFGTVKIASIGQRLGARAIDTGILFVSYIAISLFLALLDFRYGFFVFFLWLIFWLLYEWLFIAYRGATIGKAALGIKVVDQRNGGLLGLGPAFIRQLIPTVGSLFFCLGTLLVYLSPLFDNSGRVQGWHDKAANDLVVVSKAD